MGGEFRIYYYSGGVMQSVVSTLVNISFSVSLGQLILAKSLPSCSSGPSYWCESYKQAKECGAVHHCTEHVWKERLGSVRLTRQIVNN